MNYFRFTNRTKVRFDFICDEDSERIPVNEITELGGKVFLIPPYQKQISYQKKLKKLLIRRGYKIVHSHINTLSVFPLHAAKKAKVPVRIAHSHSTANKKELKKTLFKYILRPFSKIYATHLMCCSRLAGNWLFGKNYIIIPLKTQFSDFLEKPKKQVTELKNAIDTQKFRFSEEVRAEKRKELGISENTKIIGHIGRFVPQKNHDFLIDVFFEFKKIVPDSVLVLAGTGPLMKEIQNKAENLRISDSVIFLGQRNDATKLYSAFDAICMPSLYEGLSVVLVEAQAACLPCVVSSEVTEETAIKTERKKLISFMSLEKSASEWAEKLKSVAENTEKRVEMKKAFTEAGYDIENEAKKLEGYYEAALSQMK